MIDWVTDALATYRLVRLVTEDQVTANWRRRIGKRGPTADYFVHCSWCTSVYLAAGVVAARRFVPKAWSPVAQVLALSAVSGLLAERA